MDLLVESEGVLVATPAGRVSLTGAINVFTKLVILLQRGA